MNSQERLAASTENTRQLVHGELTTRRRWFYRVLLVLVSVVVTALLSLWMTEPTPLPWRVQAAFAVMVLIGSGWIIVLMWILLRRNCPTAIDRVATGWMATAACGISLVGSLVLSVMRGSLWTVISAGAVGIVVLAVALTALSKAYSHRNALLRKLETLRQVTPILLLTLTLATAKFIAQPVYADDPTLTLTSVQLPADNGATIAAQTGHLRVPLHHDQPNSGTLEIAFIRVPSDPQSTGAPTFILAGGPGDSGIEVVKRMFQGGGGIRRVLAGDIIGIDQRGAGAARPNLGVIERYGFPLIPGADPNQYQTLFITTCHKVAERLKAEGIDLSAFNTVENADDINALRAALGYEQINLWGVSYGSQLALTVLRRHESHIERVMLASPVGPDHLWKRPKHIENCLDRFASAKAPELLPLMRKVLAKLESEPVHVEVRCPPLGVRVSIVINALDLRIWTWNALAHYERMQQLPAIYRAMDAGDFEQPARWLVRYRFAAGIGSVMNHLMDAATGCSKQRHEMIQNEAHQTILDDVANWVDGAAKDLAWDVPRVSEGFHAPVESERPVLILVGEYDALTPIENAREIQATLPKACLVVIRNAGHGFRPAPDVIRVLADFFQGKTLPHEQYVN